MANGWYTVRKWGYISNKILRCPSLEISKSHAIDVPPVATSTNLSYGYRYNTRGSLHELPQQNQNTGAPSIFPMQQDMASYRVLFAEAGQYRRTGSAPFEIFPTTLSDMKMSWAHGDGGHLALADGSAHFMKNILRGQSGNHNRGSWPTSSNRTPYYSTPYIGTSISLDSDAKAHIGG